MAAGDLTHSQLTAKLVVEGCLAHIAGNVQGKIPITPAPLTELERADMGLPQGGSTLFYPLPPTGVFFDMHGARATVLFADADYDMGLDAVETAMKQAFPKLKQLKDEAHPQLRDVRLRTFQVEFGNGRLASVEIEYPNQRAQKRNFVVRVTAQARRN
jgi:hypothetical protein